MKRKSSVGKAVVSEKQILDALDGVVVALEDMSGKFAGQNLMYMRIAIDNAVAVARQYRKDFEVFFYGQKS